MSYPAHRIATHANGYGGAVPHLNLATFKETFAEWNADKAARLAAAIAYTTMFAIAPLLIITIAIVGAVLGFTGTTHPHTEVENSLLTQVSRAAGPEAAKMVRGMVDASFGKPRQSIVAQVIGWITFIIGASGVFVALQDALNEIWHAKPPAKQHFLLMVRDRLLSLAMLLVIGFLLPMTFLLNVAIAFVASNLEQALPFASAGPVFAAINWLVSLGVITLLFALIFRILPDVEIGWKDVRIGAFFTALLFVIGQAAIGFYIGKAGVASAYGAAGALLAILIWIYYSASILLLGAEFTKVYMRRNAATSNVSEGYSRASMQAG
jgi:membrane protein